MTILGTLSSSYTLVLWDFPQLNEVLGAEHIRTEYLCYLHPISSNVLKEINKLKCLQNTLQAKATTEEKELLSTISIIDKGIQSNKDSFAP